jgi:putative endonuclease
VYILQSDSTRRFYVGSTSDIEKRLGYHNAGKCRSTRKRGPWRIVHTEPFETRGEALIREQHIKAMKSRGYIEDLLQTPVQGDGKE